MTTTECIISKSPTVENEVFAKIKATLPKSIEAKEGSYLQASAGISIEVIELLFIFTLPITKGFFEELGKDAYNHLSRVLKTLFVKGKERALIFDFKSGKTDLSFRLETDDEKVVEIALKNIPEIISQANAPNSYFFDKDARWTALGGEVIGLADGVAATTDSVVVNGRRISISEEALQKAADSIPANFPIMYEHRGRPIGKLVKAWVSDRKLWVRIEIFRPRNDNERKVVEMLQSGDLRGLSIGLAFPEE